MKKTRPVRRPIRLITKELSAVVGGIDPDRLTNVDTIRNVPTKP